MIGTPGKWSTEALADALEKRTGFRQVIDMSQAVLDLEAGTLCCGDVDLCQLDGLILKKIAEDYSPDALDRLEMLRMAQFAGVRIFSPAVNVLRLMDRLACTMTLRSAAIPMPATTITESEHVAHETLDRYGAAVFKPLFSTKARGMLLLESGAEDASQQIAMFRKANPVMYIQKKLDLSGEDLGMVFLNGEYLCTYARVSQNDSWNTTIHSGGKYAPYDPAPELIELGRRAQAPFGLTFTTVDIALTADGPIVFEVSAFGGYSGAQKGCGIDAAALVVDHVLNEVSR
ncbi:GAK system ATP-grasp enzyme [Paracoccus sp. Z330]|uniref:GAK system ATP-grasp enzyme n=1 Tax=Paracoccus onchidii TaxID=3017813 RepID=A0ABT4Z9G7_9RHOB|nr:GAK system ATP-grasp enzyme [Paracoccus onchidii]MDB6175993.1 GAK system ATP-grasp enzyme [Paracoccus onchidii]